MINGMRVCSYLWLAFGALWLLAALRTKRTTERVSWLRRVYYSLPVVLGYYCTLSFDFEIPWLQHRFLPRSPALVRYPAF